MKRCGCSPIVDSCTRPDCPRRSVQMIPPDAEVFEVANKVFDVDGGENVVAVGAYLPRVEQPTFKVGQKYELIFDGVLWPDITVTAISPSGRVRFEVLPDRSQWQ